MKRYFYIIAIALVTSISICLTSCRNTDDEPAEPEKRPSIFGRWFVSKRVLYSYTINSETGEEEVFYELIQEQEDGTRELWFFSKYDGETGWLETSKGPYTLDWQEYTYDESKQEIILSPGDYDEVITNITNLTLENMTLYAEKWVEEEGFGSKCTIEFRKWWTDD